MHWTEIIDAVLICSTILLFTGMTMATIIVCLIYDKATDAPKHFVKVLAAVKEQTQWFRPHPRD